MVLSPVWTSRGWPDPMCADICEVLFTSFSKSWSHLCLSLLTPACGPFSLECGPIQGLLTQLGFSA